MAFDGPASAWLTLAHSGRDLLLPGFEGICSAPVERTTCVGEWEGAGEREGSVSLARFHEISQKNSYFAH